MIPLLLVMIKESMEVKVNIIMMMINFPSQYSVIFQVFGTEFPFTKF